LICETVKPLEVGGHLFVGFVQIGLRGHELLRQTGAQNLRRSYALRLAECDQLVFRCGQRALILLGLLGEKFESAGGALQPQMLLLLKLTEGL